MMTYDYDDRKSVIYLRVTGVLRRDDPIDYFRKLDKDTEFKPKAEERIYFTQLEDIELSYTDILEIRKAFELYGHGEKISNGIFIVDSEFSYGMARMVMTVFEPVFGNFEIEQLY